MAGFLETKKTVTCKDDFPWTAEFGGPHWVQASVAVTVSSGGKVSYTVTMTNNGGSGAGRGTYLKLVIGGKTIFNQYWSYGDNTITNSWNGFPTGHNSGVSGSFTLSNTDSSSVSVSLYVCCMQNSTSAGVSKSDTVSRTKWTDVGKGSTTITDNGNNSFKITATKGSNGTNNPASSLDTLKWGYDTNYSNTFTSGSTYSLAISGTSNTRTVYAKSRTVGKYDTAVATTSKAIKQYISPNAPGKPKISYNKNRLTIKENWTYTWTAATARNSNSPVKGYRIRLIKNGVAIKGLVVNGDTLTKGSGTNDYVDRDSTSCKVTFDPVQMGFLPKDTVSLGIYAYSKNADGKVSWKVGSTEYSLFNGNGTSSAMVVSDTSTVQNAGIVHVNVSGSWKEGQVWVKVNGSWKEADIVQTKVNGVWEESE